VLEQRCFNRGAPTEVLQQMADDARRRAYLRAGFFIALSPGASGHCAMGVAIGGLDASGSAISAQ
jgi:hypothetical protein